jgi:hypothetical protein
LARIGSAGCPMTALDTLTDTMLSHPSYQRRMLLEPLARYSFY